MIQPVGKDPRFRPAPLLVLTLCLLVFYMPMILSAGSLVTSSEGDPVTHMLFSLGDDRPGGRFFHYFDLATNARLWGNDVKYHPLHLIRLLSIALGATPLGWGLLIAVVHALLFLVVYFYSRRLWQVSEVAALAGAMVAFFATSWLEWTAKVYWTAGAVLLGVSAAEYGLFVRTGQRRHLLLCILANAFQPYVTQSQALIPTQAYLLGGVLLIAFFRRGAWSTTVRPLLLRVWPLTVLGWMPILAPLAFAVGSGLTTREALEPLGWGLNVSSLAQFLGLLFPVPQSVPLLFQKLGWLNHLHPPNSWLFGSFLLMPVLLALWQSKARSARILVAGTAGYCVSQMVARGLLVPSAFIQDVGFSRLFAFPILSGFLVAAGLDLPGFGKIGTRGIRPLHGFYRFLLGLSVIGFVVLSAVGVEALSRFAFRLGLIGSGTVFTSLFLGTQIWLAGIALGLVGYFGYLAMGKAQPIGGVVRQFPALFVAVAAPTLAFGVGAGWYQRPPELDAMLSPPSELRFLQEKIASYEYRVGVILSAEMELARGNWNGFWALSSQREEGILYHIRKNEPCLRQGLAFVLPPLHFYGPVHIELRKNGNPFSLQPRAAPARILNLREVIVRPEAQIFEEYGVRYWLSRLDLQRLHPNKFVPVYQGEYGAVFENLSAQPVAYLLGESETALPMEHLPYGVAVSLSGRKGGTLSVHLDLRQMDAHAVDSNGRTIPLLLEPSGRRWVLQVPADSSKVLFTARESAWLKPLMTGTSLAFLLSLGWLMVGQSRIVAVAGGYRLVAGGR